MKLYAENNADAAHCTVEVIGAIGRSTWRDPLTGAAHKPRVVDPEKKECECLHWQDEKFPCKDAIGYAIKKGIAANV